MRWSDSGQDLHCPGGGASDSVNQWIKWVARIVRNVSSHSHSISEEQDRLA